MRIIAIDPGEKRLGVAISDPSGMIANPLQILEHISRPIDAASIVSLAIEHEVGKIVIGQALDANDQPTFQSRRASRLAEAIRQQTVQFLGGIQVPPEWFLDDDAGVLAILVQLCFAQPGDHVRNHAGRDGEVKNPDRLGAPGLFDLGHAFTQRAEGIVGFEVGLHEVQVFGEGLPVGVACRGLWGLSIDALSQVFPKGRIAHLQAVETQH